MSLFSDKLSNYIKKSRLTLLYLSSVSNLDVSYISKIKKGERLPRKKELLVPLVNGLRLSPSEKEDLWDAYKISLIGEEQFLQYKAVKKFLSSISGVHKDSVICRYQHKIPSNSVYYGKTDIHRIIQAVLESESSKEDGYIRIVAQPDDPFLMDVLASVSLNRPQMEITQIFCLQIGSEAEKLIYNVESFRLLYPLLAYSDSYCAKYYYDDVPSHINQMNVMPFFILTSSCTVSLSADYTLADVSSDAGRQTLYDSIFRQMLSFTEDLVCHDKNFLLIPGESPGFTILSAAPFLLPYYSEKALTEMVRKDIPNFEFIAETVLSYKDRIQQMIRNSCQCITFFTEKGFKDFLQSGFLPGFSEELFYPFKTQDTISALRQFCSKQELRRQTPVLLKPDCLTLNNSFRLFTDSSSNILLFQTEKPFFLAEQSLASSVKDFLKYVIDSGDSYSATDTVKYLQKQILSLEKH